MVCIHGKVSGGMLDEIPLMCQLIQRLDSVNNIIVSLWRLVESQGGHCHIFGISPELCRLVESQSIDATMIAHPQGRYRSLNNWVIQ